MSKVAITWHPRPEPLVASAVLGLGPLALRLAGVIRARAELAEHARVVVGRGLLCAIADPDPLPWIDGVIYLGCDPAASGLYMPTCIAPQVSANLVQRALARRGVATPVAIVPDHALVFSLASARPIDADALASWMASAEASP